MLLRIIGALAAGIPLGVVVTWLLLPLWRWLEATLHVEAIGHSGPAEWCYVVTMTVTSLIVLAIWMLTARRQE